MPKEIVTSRCCKEPLFVGGEGETHYYVCSKCKTPGDPQEWLDCIPMVTNLEELDLVYRSVFGNETKQQAFELYGQEYICKYEYGRKHPKFHIGTVSYGLKDLRGLIRGHVNYN